MARKHRILLHIGPRLCEDDGLHAAVAAHESLLAGVDLVAAPVTREDIRLATHDMLRTHKSAGLKRRDVDGAWARACRRFLKAKQDLVLSAPGFHAADEAQSALILDGLRGLDVHVVVTPEEGEDPADLVATWRSQLSADLVHVAPLAGDAGPVDVAEELTGLVLCIEHQELDRRITKLKKRRKVVRKRLALREAS